MSGPSSFMSDKYICNPRNLRGGGKKKMKKITRPNFSRCSMSRLHSYMREISEGNNLIERLAWTPFGHFLQGPIITLDMLGIEYLRNNWDEQRKGFSINGIFIEFTVKDVAVILGLSRVGELIKFDNKSSDTTFYNKEFKGKVITRQVLEKKLKTLVGDNGDIMDEEKILKLSILYIFCTFLFCGVGFTLNPSFVNYVEDLTNIHTYNWAEAVHRYLIENLSRSLKEKTTSFSGCGILLNVWLYEHCQLFTDVKVKGVHPHLFRWPKVKLRRRSTFFNIFKDVNNEMIKFEIESEANEEGLSDKEKEGGDINKELVVHTEDVHREDIQDIPVHEDMPDVISQEGIPDRECTTEIDKLKDDLERVTIERDELLSRYNQLQLDVAEEKKRFKYASMVESTELKSNLDNIMSKVKRLVQEKLDMQEAINSQASEFQAIIKKLNDEKQSLQVASEAYIEEYENKIKEIREEYKKKLQELTSSYDRLKEDQEEDSVEKEENDDNNDNDNDGEKREKVESKGEGKRQFFLWALVSPFTQVTKRRRIVEMEAIEVDENAPDKPYIDEGYLEMKRAALRNKSVVVSNGNLSDCEDGGVARKMRSTRDEGTPAFKDHGSEGALTRRAEMYQKYMSLIPIPAQRGSLVPCTSWQGLAKSMKELYGQPLHYLTNILLKQWDQSRIGHNDEYQPLDTIIHPSKAEALIWVTEEVHRLTTSHHYLTKLWASDAMYHMSIDPIFP